MKPKKHISDFLVLLVSEGEHVLTTKWTAEGNYLGGAPQYVDLQSFKQWRSSCNLLISLLGRSADPWRHALEGDSGNTLGAAHSMLGTLKAIQNAIDNDLIMRIEDIVYAEAFADLVEQAEYLLEQGYFLAAGVILRAVLEERLRQMCDSRGCLPSKVRPTISDFNTELYKNNVYDKIAFKGVDLMAAIGNLAAHNKPELRVQNVEDFKKDLISFLSLHSA